MRATTTMILMLLWPFSSNVLESRHSEPFFSSNLKIGSSATIERSLTARTRGFNNLHVPFAAPFDQHQLM